MKHVTLVMAAYLFKVHLELLCQTDSILFIKADFLKSFLLYNKQKKIDNAYFSKKNVLIAKKRPLKMTSTTLLFREAEQLGVYQLLPNLTIWHQWACEHLCKTSVENPGPLSLQQTQSHYINWLDYYIGGCWLLYFAAACL